MNDKNVLFNHNYELYIHFFLQQDVPSLGFLNNKNFNFLFFITFWDSINTLIFLTTSFLVGK